MENALHKPTDHVKTDEAKDDRGNTGQKLNNRLKDLGAKLRGLISTAKMAEPMAMGSAMSVESTMTANEVTIRGRGAGVGQAAFGRVGQVPLGAGEELNDRNAVLIKAERPFWATIKMSARNDKRHGSLRTHP